VFLSSVERKRYEQSDTSDAGGEVTTGEAAAEDVMVQRDLEYASHDGVSLRGDLYQPTTPGFHPAVIALHGGAWKGGSRQSYRYWGPWLAARGIALFTIDYRLATAGKGSYPHAVQDVCAAVQFIRGKGEALNIDANRIGLMGDSAGGHLSALVALASDEAPFANAYPDDPFAKISARVKAVIAFYGVFDLPQQWTADLRRRPDNIPQVFMGVPLTENRKLYNEASPLTYAVRARNDVSFLLIHGTEDDVVEPVQSKDFQLALRLAGFYTRMLTVQAAGHYFVSDPIEEPFSRTAEVSRPMLRFIRDKI
jgi:acetyl esterase/lipase